jgi:hypothetical protein
MDRWLGVDVGGERKGFDVALIDGERQLARSICGIRWTPDERAALGSQYYAWVVQGLALFEALAGRGAELSEVFPTAPWTRWLGKRGGRTRVAWTRDGMSALDLRGLPARTNQDQRDAIAAALTARLHDRGLTEAIGEIVVPLHNQGEPRARTLGSGRLLGGVESIAQRPTSRVAVQTRSRWREVSDDGQGDTG